jgi:hypothetical protein
MIVAKMLREIAPLIFEGSEPIRVCTCTFMRMPMACGIVCGINRQGDNRVPAASRDASVSIVNMIVT